MAARTPLALERPLTQNGCHFTDIFKCISLIENVWISIKISLKFVPKGSFNNIPVLVQIMAWHRPGDKPLSEPMMINLPTYICISRPLNELTLITDHSLTLATPSVIYADTCKEPILFASPHEIHNAHYQDQKGAGMNEIWIILILYIYSFLGYIWRWVLKLT